MKIQDFNVSYVKQFTNPAPIEEDPESSQSVFEDADISAFISEFNPYKVINDHDLAQQVLKIYENLLSANVYEPPIHRSYKSLSLAEALVIIELLHYNKNKISYAKLKLDTNSKFTSKHIHVELSFFSEQHKLLTTYNLIYDSSIYCVSIKQNKKSIGKVKYYLRGKKCEEIIGTFKGKKLSLDPVWHPKKKGVLKHIIVEFEGVKTTLIFHSNSKESVGRSTKLNVKNNRIKKTSSQALVKKEVEINAFKIKTSLLYDKKILLPILGSWEISTI
jgi:hypothetical protein